MKKNAVKKAARSSVKRIKSAKAVWHKMLPIKWSYFSISIMSVLAALAIILPQTGVLGATQKPVQVDINTVMKDSSVAFSGSLTLKVVQTTDVKSTKKTSTLDTRTITNLPTTYSFAATNGTVYTITLTVGSGTNYKVLNGYRVVVVRNNKTECKGTGKNNPCTFFVMSKSERSVSSSEGLKQSEQRSTSVSKPKVTCIGKCVPTTIFKTEHMTSGTGTCQPNFTCAK